MELSLVIKWSRRANSMIVRILWSLVILGIIAFIPLAYHRVKTEDTSKNVEFVFNYQNTLSISDYKNNPKQSALGYLCGDCLSRYAILFI